MTQLGQEGNPNTGWGCPIAGTSHDDDQPARPFDLARLTHCLAAVVRCPTLANLLEFGEQGRTEERSSMPIALCVRSPQHAAVWEAAQRCVRDLGRIPDRTSFAATAETLVTEIEDYARSGDDVVELITEIFADRFDQLDEDAARNAVIDLMEELLVLEPQAQALGEWRQHGGTAPMGVCRRVAQLQSELDEHRSGQGQRLRGYSVSEMRRLAAPPRWHVQGLLVHGETAFLAGPAKSLKSGLSVDLAASLAMPADFDRESLFLNHFPVERENHVLLFSAESGMWVVLQRLDQVVAGKPMSLAMGNRRLRPHYEHPADSLNLTTFFNPPRLSLKEDQRIVRRMIREHRAGIAIFDPFYLMAISGTKTEASSVYQMGEAIRRIEDVCKDEGATPVFVHHFRKDIKIGEVPTLSHMTQAGATEMAAQWILVNHRKPFDVGNGHARLMIFYGGRAGHAGCRAVNVTEGQLRPDFSGREWRVDVQTLTDAEESDARCADHTERTRTEATTTRHVALVESYLDAHSAGEGICLTTLAREVNLNNNNCRRALDRLINLGRVEETEVQLRNGTYPAYRRANAILGPANGTTEGEHDNGRQ